MATIALAGVIAGTSSVYAAAAIAMAAAMIDGMIFSALAGTQKTSVEGNRMDDLKLQSSTYGAAIPKVFGKSRVTGNVIWGTNYTEHVKTETQKQGKGGGGSEVTTTTYSYSTDFAVGLCEGQITGIGRIWADGNLWADLSSYSFDETGVMVINGMSKNTPQQTGYMTLGTYRVGATDINITGSILALINKLNIKLNVGDRITFGTDGNIYTIKEKKSIQYEDSNGEKGGRDVIVISPALVNSVSARKQINLTAAAGVNAIKGDFNWLKVYQGTDVQPRDDFMNSKTGGCPAHRGMAYIVFNSLYVDKFGRRIPSFSFEIIRGSGGTNATEVINSVCYGAGLSLNQVEAGDAGNCSMVGITIGNATTKSVIDELRAVYQLDTCEREGAIHFTRRQQETFGPRIWLIEDTDIIGAYESEKSDEPYSINRKEENELPRKVTLSYYSADKEYQTGTMSTERVNTISNSDESLNFAGIITDSQAKELTEDILWYKWAQRNTYNLTLPSRYASMLPGDAIRLTLSDSRTVFLTVVKSAYGKPGINKITAESRNFLPKLIDKRQIDKDVDKNIRYAIEDFEFTAFEVFTPTDGKVRLVAAVTSDWSNASANNYAPRIATHKSQDGGLTWGLVGQNYFESIYGTTIDKLGNAIPELWDEGNTVTVKLKGKRELSSRPRADILTGYFNVALVGNEIVQFCNAELIEADTYKLSGFIRGKYGTELNIVNHVIGDRFILLELDSLLELNSNASELYLPTQYRIGPASVHLDQHKEFEHAFYGIPYKPYPVCHVKGIRADNNDWEISWIRRSRTDSTWKPYVDNGLGEDVEAYEVDIMSGTSVKRTLKTSTPSIIYTANHQQEDFNQTQSSLKIKIYQMSTVVGRGNMKEVVL